VNIISTGSSQSVDEKNKPEIQEEKKQDDSDLLSDSEFFAVDTQEPVKSPHSLSSEIPTTNLERSKNSTISFLTTSNSQKPVGIVRPVSPIHSSDESTKNSTAISLSDIQEVDENQQNDHVIQTEIDPDAPKTPDPTIQDILAETLSQTPSPETDKISKKPFIAQKPDQIEKLTSIAVREFFKQKSIEGIWSNRKNHQFWHIENNQSSFSQEDCQAKTVFRECLLQNIEANINDISRKYGNVELTVLEFLVQRMIKEACKTVEELRSRGSARKRWDLEMTKRNAMDFLAIEAIKSETAEWINPVTLREMTVKVKNSITSSILDGLIDEVLDDLMYIDKLKFPKAASVHSEIDKTAITEFSEI